MFRWFLKIDNVPQQSIDWKGQGMANKSHVVYAGNWKLRLCCTKRYPWSKVLTTRWLKTAFLSHLGHDRIATYWRSRGSDCTWTGGGYRNIFRCPIWRSCDTCLVCLELMLLSPNEFECRCYYFRKHWNVQDSINFPHSLGTCPPRLDLVRRRPCRRPCRRLCRLCRARLRGLYPALPCQKRRPCPPAGPRLVDVVGLVWPGKKLFVDSQSYTWRIGECIRISCL